MSLEEQRRFFFQLSFEMSIQRIVSSDTASALEFIPVDVFTIMSVAEMQWSMSRELLATSADQLIRQHEILLDR